jgi:hypothetical protein
LIYDDYRFGIQLKLFQQVPLGVGQLFVRAKGLQPGGKFGQPAVFAAGL